MMDEQKNEMELHKLAFIEQVKALLFTDEEIANMYDRAVSGEPGRVNSIITRDFGPDRINFQLILLRDERGLPGLSGFRTTLLKIGEIQHTRYQGIDTRELERTIAAADWRGSLKEFPVVFDKVALLEMSKDPQVKHIAHQLIAKYWIDTHIESYIHMGQYRDKFTQTATFHIEAENKMKMQNLRNRAGSGQKYTGTRKKGHKPKR